MKKLNRLLLINWHYFSKQIVDFGDINFLTGANTAGKSTVIDALQVVLMGETRSSAFNRAASKKSERTLKSYLIGSMGEDIENGIKSIRGGKDFTSYLVVECYDNIKDEYFCFGAVFDVYSDGSDIKKRFFYLRGRLPNEQFISGGYAMDTVELAEYFKKNYPQRHQITGTIQTYQELVLSKLNVHDRKMFSMLKKAISFEPINDIENFITENVCDTDDENDIDIATMQENISYYMRQEELAKVFEKKLEALEQIRNAFSEVKRFFAQKKRQQFLIDYAAYETAESELKNAEAESEQYDKDIQGFSERYRALEGIITKLEQDKKELEHERNKYRLENNVDRLEEDIKRYETALKEADNKIGSFVLSVRRNCEKWLDIICSAQAAVATQEFDELCSRLCESINRLENIREDNIGDHSVGFFRDISSQYNSIKMYASPVWAETAGKLIKVRQDRQELEAAIEKLESGIMQYPEKAQAFKDAVAYGLYKKYGHTVNVDFFADLIDVSNDEWHNAVEGYLNTQRMNLIIEPEYFRDAYNIYKEKRHEIGAYEYRIVDCDKVLKANRNIVQDSLSDVVSSDNIYAKAYAEYLMGSVTRCYDDKKIREHRRSVTRECMIYSGFSVGSLNKNAYSSPYIGRDSLEKQITIKRRDLEAIMAKIADLSSIETALKPIIEQDWFLSDEYISSTVKDIFDINERRANDRTELDKLHQLYESLDLFWITEMNNKIEDKDIEIKAAYKDKEETAKFISNYKNEKERTITQKIPAIKQEIKQCKERINERYDEEYISSIKSGYYDAELKKRGTPQAVANGFESPLKQTETLLKDKCEDVINLRSEYNRVQNVSFSFSDPFNNNDYENEYVKIKDTELPKYREEIKKAKEDAMAQFKSDFLYKLQRNINDAIDRIDELNRALKNARFGNDTYRFKVEPAPEYREYYDMITSDLLMNGDNTLFSYEFTNKYQSTLDSLFSQIICLSDNDRENAARNIEMFSKYTTYLSFDLYSTDINGTTVKLSKSMSTNSGGETQTPFYIAVLASFAQLYKVNDNKETGNTFRLVIFDEAFSNMDNERSRESIKLLKCFKLQAIICAPSDKAANIAPIVDSTLLVNKEMGKNGYRSSIIKWTKEMSDSYGSSQTDN